MRYLWIYLHMKETEAGVGHPAKDRVALARAFVAKATLNLPTTEALIDRLKVDQPLRRLCGFSSRHRIPGKHRFSRAKTSFADVRLAERSHEFLIQTHLSDQLIGHATTLPSKRERGRWRRCRRWRSQTRVAS